MRLILPRFSLSPVWKTKLIRRLPFRVCQRVNTSRSFLAMARRFINVVLLIVRPVNIGRTIAGTLATGDCSRVLCSFLSVSPIDSPSPRGLCRGEQGRQSPATPYEKNQFRNVMRTLRLARSRHYSQPVPLVILCSRDHSGIQRSFFLCAMRGGKCAFCFRGLSCQ